ncbi:dual specificity protein kinase yak1, partial [Irineochytrium annulatum]
MDPERNGQDAPRRGSFDDAQTLGIPQTRKPSHINTIAASSQPPSGPLTTSMDILKTPSGFVSSLSPISASSPSHSSPASSTVAAVPLDTAGPPESPLPTNNENVQKLERRRSAFMQSVKDQPDPEGAKEAGTFRGGGFRPVTDWETVRTSHGKPPAGYIGPTKSLTRFILRTYVKCNAGFSYQTEQNPRRVLTKPSKPVHNDGFDNEDWDYILYVNDILGSQEGQQYQILDILGQGTFGQVVKCQNIKTKANVAVKVIKNKPAYYNQSLVEVAILDMLNNEHDKMDKHHIVCMKDTFLFRNHLCIIFEMLSVNLYELIKQNQFRGLSTNLVRVFVQQILECLVLLNKARIIHCDLKPENILLKNLDSPTIKVIDFGSACHESQTVYTYIQSRFYRSPEVLLGLPYTSSIDMWSLGCIAAELFLGLPLFPGSSEYNQVARIAEMLGVPHSYMCEKGKTAHQFFEKHGEGKGTWRLKSIEQYMKDKDNGCQELPSKRYFNGTTLPEIVKSYPVMRKGLSPKEIDKEMQNRLAFTDFLLGLLQLNPLERWSPQQAKMHPFVTGEKFTGPFAPPLLIPKTPTPAGLSMNPNPNPPTATAGRRPRANTISSSKVQTVPPQLQRLVAIQQQSGPNKTTVKGSAGKEAAFGDGAFSDTSSTADSSSRVDDSDSLNSFEGAAVGFNSYGSARQALGANSGVSMETAGRASGMARRRSVAGSRSSVSAVIRKTPEEFERRRAMTSPRINGVTEGMADMSLRMSSNSNIPLGALAETASISDSDSGASMSLHQRLGGDQDAEARAKLATAVAVATSYTQPGDLRPPGIHDMYFAASKPHSTSPNMMHIAMDTAQQQQQPINPPYSLSQHPPFPLRKARSQTITHYPQAASRGSPSADDNGMINMPHQYHSSDSLTIGNASAAHAFLADPAYTGAPLVLMAAAPGHPAASASGDGIEFAGDGHPRTGEKGERKTLSLAETTLIVVVPRIASERKPGRSQSQRIDERFRLSIRSESTRGGAIWIVSEILDTEQHHGRSVASAEYDRGPGAEYYDGTSLGNNSVNGAGGLVSPRAPPSLERMNPPEMYILDEEDPQRMNPHTQHAPHHIYTSSTDMLPSSSGYAGLVGPNGYLEISMNAPPPIAGNTNNSGMQQQAHARLPLSGSGMGAGAISNAMMGRSAIQGSGSGSLWKQAQSSSQSSQPPSLGTSPYADFRTAGVYSRSNVPSQQPLPSPSNLQSSPMDSGVPGGHYFQKRHSVPTLNAAYDQSNQPGAYPNAAGYGYRATGGGGHPVANGVHQNSSRRGSVSHMDLASAARSVPGPGGAQPMSIPGTMYQQGQMGHQGSYGSMNGMHGGSPSGGGSML